MNALKPEPRKEAQPPTQGGRPQVLLIDDEAGVRRMTQLVLQQAGFEVTPAFDGEDGLLKYQPGKFAAVVCDRKMPGEKQGDDVIRAIKTMDRSQGVIMVAAGADKIPADVKATIRADCYLDKPVSAEALIGAIREVSKQKV
jgi:CheY-like chemotaxis protein